MIWSYIIIGGGASGCVLANRLSENIDNSVLLIESGPKDKHPYIHMPIGFAKLTVGSGPYTWGYTSTKQKNCFDRSGNFRFYWLYYRISSRDCCFLSTHLCNQ